MYPNKSLEYATNRNLVKVNVYFEDLTVTDVTDSPSYGLDLFMADIGMGSIDS